MNNKNKNVKVNIIMCTHNGSKYISDQLYSISSQTILPDHIYIYDFNSKDDTRIKILKFISLNPKISISLKENDFAYGAKESFFFAIKDVANYIDHNHVIFLSDQDDIWESKKIEIQLSRFINECEFENESCDIPIVLFHNISVVDEEIQLLHKDYFNNNPNLLPRDLYFDRLMIGNCIIGHTMMINYALVKIISKIKNTSAYAMHDWACALFAAHHGKLIYIDSFLTKYRQHDNNVLGVSGKNRKLNIYRLANYGRTTVNQLYAFYHDIENVKEYRKIKKFNSEYEYVFDWLASLGVKKKFFLFLIPLLILIRGSNLKKKLMSIFFLLGLFLRD